MNIVAVVSAGLVWAFSVGAVSAQTLVNRNGRIADVFDTPAAKPVPNSRTITIDPPAVNVPAASYVVTPATPVTAKPVVTSTTLRILPPSAGRSPASSPAGDSSAFGDSSVAKFSIPVTASTPPVVTANAPSFAPAAVPAVAPLVFPSAPVAYSTPSPPAARISTLPITPVAATPAAADVPLVVAVVPSPAPVFTPVAAVAPAAPVARAPVISRAPIPSDYGAAPVPTAAPLLPRFANIPAPRTTTPAFDGRSSGASKSYVMSPNDLVEVKVFQEPDLDSKVRVSKDGTVTLPLIGSVRFAGRTVDEASAIVRDTLDRRFIVNPQVSLTVVDYAKRRFTVMGEVQKPGSFEIPNEENVNLLQAIALAGGYTRIGEPTKVTVVRVENGQRVVHKLNAKAMARDQKSKPFEIQAEDTVTVGESVF